MKLISKSVLGVLMAAASTLGSIAANAVSPLMPSPGFASNIAVGRTPNECASGSLSGNIYVTNSGSNSVSVISQESDSVIATIPVGNYPVGIAENPVTRMVYVINIYGNSVSVIDESTNTVIATVPTGAFPHKVTVDAFTNTIFVSNRDSNEVTVINGDTNQVTATLSGFWWPHGVAFDPQSKNLYVVNYYGRSVSVIDTSTMTHVALIPIGLDPIGILYDSQTKLLYAANRSSNNVSVIDPLTNTVIGTIAVGETPQMMVSDPSSSSIFTGNSGDGTVSQISVASNQVISTIHVGGNPYGLCLGPRSGEIYVVNYSSNSVSVLRYSPPAAPLVAAPTSTARGALTWTWGASADVGFPILNYTWSGACSGSGLVNEVTCTGLTGGGNYTLNVVASSSHGTSIAGVSSGIALDVPSSPSVTSTSGASPGQAIFTWTQPSTGGSPITSYTWAGACSGSGLVTSVTCSGLRGGSQQTLNLIAINQMGSSPTGSSSITMPIVAPDTPSLSVVPNSSSITVTWIPPFNGGSPLVGYLLSVQDASGKVVTRLAPGANATSAVVKGLTNGSAYSVSLVAQNASNLLSSAGIVSGVTPKATVLITTATKTSATYGAAVSLSAHLPAGLSGSVTFSAGGVALCTAKVSSAAATCSMTHISLDAGTYSLAANYSGNTSTAAALATGTLLIHPAASTLKIFTNQNSVSSNRLSALVVSYLLSSANATVPPGLVTISLDGKLISNDASTFNFAAWSSGKNLPIGLHTLTATYGGSKDYLPITATCKFAVQK